MVNHIGTESHRHVTGLDAAAVVIEDEVLTKSVNISYGIFEVCILNTCDLCCSRRLNAWPTAAEVIDITPLIECNRFPASLVVYIYADGTLV